MESQRGTESQRGRERGYRYSVQEELDGWLDEPENRVSLRRLIKDDPKKDLLRVPASLDQAITHEKANSFGKNPKVICLHDVCHCCAKVEKEQISFCDRDFYEVIGYKGSGLPQHFKMIIFTIIFLMVPCCITSGFYIYFDNRGHNCITKDVKRGAREYIKSKLQHSWGPEIVFTKPLISKTLGDYIDKPQGIFKKLYSSVQKHLNSTQSLDLFEQTPRKFINHLDDFTENKTYGIRRKLPKRFLQERLKKNRFRKQSSNAEFPLKQTRKSYGIKLSDPFDFKNNVDLQNIGAAPAVNAAVSNTVKPAPDVAVNNTPTPAQNKPYVNTPMPAANAPKNNTPTPAQNAPTKNKPTPAQARPAKSSKYDKVVKAHTSKLYDCKKKVADGTYNFSDLILCKQYNPEMALKNTSNSAQINFMFLFCNSRQDYVDPSCDQYVKLKCNEVTHGDYFWKTLTTAFTHNKEKSKVTNQAFEKSLRTNSSFQDKCRKIAFSKFIIIRTLKTCTKKKGNPENKFYESPWTLGNRINNIHPSSWYFDLNMFTVFSMFIMIQLWYLYLRISKYELNTVQNPHKYTVEINDLPEFKDLAQEEAKNYIAKFFNDLGYKVSNVTLVYECEKYQALIQQKNDLKNSLAKCTYMKKHMLTYTWLEKYWKGIEKDGNDIETIIEELADVCTQIVRFTTKYRNNEGFLKVAFVSFQNQSSKSTVKKRFGIKNSNWPWLRALCCCPSRPQEKLTMTQDNHISGDQETKDLKLTNPPLPGDVCFENMAYDNWWSFLWRNLVKDILISIAFFVFLMILNCIKFYQQSIKNYANEFGAEYSMWQKIVIKYIEPYVFPFIITYLSTKIGEITEYCFEFVKYRNRNELRVWNATYNFKYQFLASGAIPVAMSTLSGNFLGESGLLATINGIFWANILLNFTYFYDFQFLTKSKADKQKEYVKSLQNKKHQALYTQKDVNSLFEREDFGITEKYANHMKLLSLSIYFLPMLPTGIFWTLATFFLEYWILKYKITTQNTNRINYNNEMAFLAVNEFNFMMFVFTFGMVTKEFVVTDMNAAPFWIENHTTVLLVLTFLNWIIGSDWYQFYIWKGLKPCLISCGIMQKKDANLCSHAIHEMFFDKYEDQEVHWDKTYSTANPMDTKAKNELLKKKLSHLPEELKQQRARQQERELTSNFYSEAE